MPVTARERIARRVPVAQPVAARRDRRLGSGRTGRSATTMCGTPPAPVPVFSMASPISGRGPAPTTYPSLGRGRVVGCVRRSANSSDRQVGEGSGARDGQHFDAITRAMAAATSSRCRVRRVSLAGGGAGVAALLGLGAPGLASGLPPPSATRPAAPPLPRSSSARTRAKRSPAAPPTPLRLLQEHRARPDLRPRFPGRIQQP